MANMVFRIGPAPEPTGQSSLELYKDVSMDAKRTVLPETGDDGYFVGKLVNVKAVQNSLRQIFSWTPGERVLNPEFGCRLRQYLYEGLLDYNVEQIMAEVQHCFTEWEPRAQLQNVVHVKDDGDAENNTVRLDVYYTIPGLSDQQYVYSYVYDRGAAAE